MKYVIKGGSKMKKLIEKWILKYVTKNKNLQNEIVSIWSGGNEIKKYYIKDSEVTLSNVNMIYSTITGCIIKEMTHTILKDSPMYIETK
jgi:hypothetical protein